MENHPLNLAHQQYRRAEAHLRYNRFDEAIQCHHNAAELLLDAMKTTTCSVALESITLQHSYHLKQKDLVKHKKEQYTRVKKAMENLKKISKEPTSTPVQENAKIQIAIYKTMNEADSLLDILTHKKDGDKISEVVNNTTGKDAVDGKTVEKNQDTVIEELQILNHNLHTLIDQLVTQVEVLKDENTTLHERVLYLEKERNKYLNLQTSQFIQESHFSNLSMGNENFKDLSTMPEAGTVHSKPYSAVPRQIQQPHFDLSAFKDD